MGVFAAPPAQRKQMACVGWQSLAPTNRTGVGVFAVPPAQRKKMAFEPTLLHEKPKQSAK